MDLDENFRPKLSIVKISKMPLKTVMDRDFLRLSPEDTIRTLIAGLEHRDCALVTDERGNLLGFISLDEIINLLIPPTDYILVGLDALREAHFDWDMKVKEIMNTRPITLSPDDTLSYALGMMIETGVRQFPIVENNKAVGTFSAHTIIKLLRVFMGR